MKKFMDRIDLSYLKTSRGPSYHGRRFPHLVRDSLRVKIVLIEKIDSCHRRDHFGQTGDFSDFVNPFAVVVHEFVIFV